MTVTLGGVVLADGVDYTRSYADNIAVGTATATIIGIGNCTGTFSATFDIVGPGRNSPEAAGTVLAAAVGPGRASRNPGVSSAGVLSETGDASLLSIAAAVLLLAGAGCLLAVSRRRRHR